MSHAVLLVVLKDGETLTDAMAPYYEATEDPVYLQWEDCTEEVRKGAEEKGISMDEYNKEFGGYQKKHNKYGYLHNPEATWDWYEIGGRWEDFLKLTKEVKNPSFVFSSKGGYKEGITHCNECLREDFDYEGQKEEAKRDHLFYAVLKDGNWYGRATLGWWGVSKDEVDDWPAREKELLESCDPKDQLILVDYHI